MLLQAQQYIPYFNRTRVIAIRAAASLAFRQEDLRIPFYLQPALGGNDDLRGFQRYRFYDDQALIVNVEHRWLVSSMLDMAVFVDAGKVAPRLADIDFTDLEWKWSGGIGFRFKFEDAYVMRIDFAAGREGFRFMWTFSDIFKAGRDLLSKAPHEIPTPLPPNRPYGVEPSELYEAAQEFLTDWLVRRDIDEAAQLLSPQILGCVNTDDDIDDDALRGRTATAVLRDGASLAWLKIHPLVGGARGPFPTGIQRPSARFSEVPCNSRQRFAAPYPTRRARSLLNFLGLPALISLS